VLHASRAKRVSEQRESAEQNDGAKGHLLDHQQIGAQQELWFSHSYAPGSPFFLPGGAHIYNKLIELCRRECQKRGYDEVLSPQMLSADLFAQSGHLDHYEDDIFLWSHDGRRVGLKPMSCPCHCLMFSHRVRSYRELPMRLAEFGIVHRNECSGSLSGLRRVVRFCQDDAHIFCEDDEACIAAEVLAVLELQQSVYRALGLKASLELASRPAKALGGNDELWDKAERALRSALQRAVGEDWSMDAGGGAFYGPKIDCKVQDAAGRWLQCASVQLDFQMPRRFRMKYMDADGGARVPVMIHRAVLGSIERMFAVLSEHHQGRWPFWLSPRQALLLPVKADDKAQCAAAMRAHEELRAAGFAVDVDVSRRDMRQKIKEAEGHSQRGELWRYNCVLLFGSRELEANSVSMRMAGESRSRCVPLAELHGLFRELAAVRI